MLDSIRELKSKGSCSFPGWDHEIGDPVPDAIHVDSSIPIVLFEGNYLLYDALVWIDIAREFDIRWKLQCKDMSIAMDRVLLRHQKTMKLDYEAAKARIDTNDRINADLIEEKTLVDLVSRFIDTSSLD